MLKRILIVLLLTVLATAATATAQNPQVVRAATTLQIQRMPPNPAVSNEALYYAHLGVEAAKQWLIQQGFLAPGFANYGFTVYNTGNSFVGVYSAPGVPDVVIVLGPGPTFPRPEQDYVYVPMTAVIRTYFSS